MVDYYSCPELKIVIRRISPFDLIVSNASTIGCPAYSASQQITKGVEKNRNTGELD